MGDRRESGRTGREPGASRPRWGAKRVHVSRRAERPEVEEAGSWLARRRFVELPYRLHRGDPCWVPPLRFERRRFLSARRNPYFAHADVALWLARRGGEIVGRVSSQIDHLHTAAHGERVVAFGHFECAPDPEAAAALLAAAACWGEERGAALLRGPMSFSMHHEAGLLVEGFDEPPVIGMPYNPPYYAELLERAGLVKKVDLLGARAELGPFSGRFGGLPEDVIRVAGEVGRLAGVTVRHMQERDFAAEAERVVSVYNRAWANNWGFVPLAPEEGRVLARDLGRVIVPELAVVAEAGGEPVGVLLGIRDLNRVLIRLRGRLLPLGWLELVRRTRQVDACRLILFGVLEAFRGLGVDALLIVEALRAGLAAGFRSVDMSWILETNQAVLRPLLSIGARLGVRLHRRYRIYERPLPWPRREETGP